MTQSNRDLAEALASTPVAIKDLPGNIRTYICSNTNDDPGKFAALTSFEIDELAQRFMHEHAGNTQYNWSYLCLRPTLDATELLELDTYFQAVRQIIKNQVVNRKRNNQKMAPPQSTPPSKKLTLKISSIHLDQDTSSSHRQPGTTNNTGAQKTADLSHAAEVDGADGGDSLRGFSADRRSSRALLQDEDAITPDRPYANVHNDRAHGVKRKRSSSGRASLTSDRSMSLSSDIEFLESRNVHESITAASSRIAVKSTGTQTETMPANHLADIECNLNGIETRVSGTRTIFDFPPIAAVLPELHREPCERCNAATKDSDTQTTVHEDEARATQTDRLVLHEMGTQATPQSTSIEVQPEEDDADSDTEDTCHGIDFKEAEHRLKTWRAEELEITHKRRVADKTTKARLKERQQELQFVISMMDALVHLKTIRTSNEPSIAA